MLIPLFLLTFFFPITLYCTLLAGINRRSRPLIVSGVWDFVALLLACSGFLLAAGPAILRVFYDESYRALILRPGEQLWEWVTVLWSEWWIFWLFYYGVIVVGALLLLRSRRRTTVIYNLEPGLFDTVWAQTMEQCRLLWTRIGNQIYMRKPLTGELPTQKPVGHEIILNPNTPVTEPPDLMGNRNVGPNRHQLAVKVDIFPVFCNVSLHWSGQSAPLRQEIENELTKVISTVHTEDNPSANWLLGAATGLFGLMVFCLVVMFLVADRSGG